VRAERGPGRWEGDAVCAPDDLVGCIPLPLALVDGDGLVRVANGSLAALLGVDRRAARALRGTLLADVLRPADGDAPPDLGALLVADRPSRPHRFARRTGTPFWGRVSVRAVPRGDGRRAAAVHFVVGVEDVTEQVEGLRLLHDAEQRGRALMSAAPVGIFLADRNGRCTFANDRCAELADLATLDDLASWRDVVHPDDVDRVLAVWNAAVEAGSPFHGEYRLRRGDGEELWVQTEATPITGPGGELEGLLGTMVDVTPTRTLLRQLERQAMHDLLTGLANRAALLQQLERALPVPSHAALAVLFCDLDGFKAVNDGLGHDAGDALLGAIAERMVEAVGQGGVVARFGGDEFVLLITDMDPATAAETAAATAERVVAAVVRPVPVAGTVATVSASVGIALALPGGGDDADALLRGADLAMYQAKLAGKGRWRVFDRELRACIDARRDLEDELRAGFPARFSVRYTPVVDLLTRTPAAFEATPCWDHPRLGPLGPDEFLDVATEAGLDVEIERWVIGRAAEDAAERAGAGEPAGTTWVAVSSRNLRRGDFAELVAATVERTGIDPELLGVAVHQQALVRHAKQVATTVEWLSLVGVRTAIEEFGVEAFSIPLLQELHVQVVRLHHDLVAHLGDDPRALVGVAAVTGVARALGITVVATGVRTDAQAALLESVGCRAAQGPLFATDGVLDRDAVAAR
jgi:diguanylate cyclase (GGDEF)-like protein/PAS domain S-box-containing protein